jgi:hypothetical protein
MEMKSIDKSRKVHFDGRCRQRDLWNGVSDDGDARSGNGSTVEFGE